MVVYAVDNGPPPYRPKRMSVDDLEAGLRWLFAELYSDAEFIRRRRAHLDIHQQLRRKMNTGKPR